MTMEDMVEEIVGEIHDEHEPERDVKKEADGSYVLSGSFDLDRLKELIGIMRLQRERNRPRSAGW